MAGHSKFKNIQHRKNAQDSKRAKQFTKIVREIVVAVKTGRPEPEFNPRLRSAIASAKVLNLPKEKIENAIKKGTATNDGENYEEMRYEGYASGGIAIVIEALTDNRNRTASEIRTAFSKNGGNLGETGSLSFMFERLGLIEYDFSVAAAEEMMEAAIESGASDCVSNDEIHEITCEVESFSIVRDHLLAKFGDANISRLTWRAKDFVEIEDEEKFEKILKLIEVLEDNDDVQFVYSNLAM